MEALKIYEKYEKIDAIENAVLCEGGISNKVN